MAKAINVFDELATRLKKRPDSGIHNSTEIDTMDKTESNNKTQNEDQTDSGRDSDHGNELRKSNQNLEKTKKKGLLSNIKKIFKRKSRKSKDNENLTKSEEDLSASYKSRSESDIYSSHSNKDESSSSSRVNNESKLDVLSEPEDLKSPDKKQPSLKDAPHYIRSSLRKLKLKRKKSNSSSGTPSIDSKRGSLKDEETTRSPVSDTQEFNMDENESFFNITMSEDLDRIPLSASGPVDLNDIAQITPQIETSAAKDRIRIAPQNRRKPTKFASRKGGGNNSERVGRLSSLSKLSEDEVSLNSPNQSRDLTKKPSFHESKENVYNNRRSSRTSSNGSSQEIKKSSIVDLPGLRKSSLLGSLEFRKSSLFASQELKNLTEENTSPVRKSSSGKKDNNKGLFDLNSSLTSNERSFSVGHRSQENLDKKRSRPLIKPRGMANSTSNHMIESQSRSKSMGNLSEVNDEDQTKPKRNIVGRGNSVKNIFHRGSTEDDGMNEFQKSREKLFKKASMKKRNSEDHFEHPRTASISNENARKNSTEATFALLTKPKSSEEGNNINKDIEMQNEFKLKRTRPSSLKHVEEDKAELKNIDIVNATPKGKPIPSPKKNRRDTSPIIPSNSPSDSSDTNTTTNFSRISLKKVTKTDDFMELVKSNEALNQENTTDTKSKISRIPSLRKPARKDDFIEHNKGNETHSESITSQVAPKESKIPSRMSVKAMSRESDIIPSVKSVSREGDTIPDKNEPEVSGSKIPAFSRVSLRKVPKSNDFLEKNKGSEVCSPELMDTSEHQSEVDRSSSGEHFGFNRTTSIGNKPKALSKKNNEFTFQSRDLIRSKTLPSKDMKNKSPSKSPPKSPAPPPEEEKSKIPEWVKLARQKQRDEEQNNEANIAKTEIKPSITQKPKTNPRPDFIPRLTSPPVRSISPTKTSKSFNTKAEVSKDICIVCNKTAYMFEKCEVDNHTLHKLCAKCVVCSRKLNVGAIFIEDNKVLCSQHK